MGHEKKKCDRLCGNANSINFGVEILISISFTLAHYLVYPIYMCKFP
jgi:hypothetical protein